MLDEAKLLADIEVACKRVTTFLGLVTEFHGGALGTEYMMTAFVAEALAQAGHAVSVEAHNRKLLGLFGEDGRSLKSIRTDVAIL